MILAALLPLVAPLAAPDLAGVFPASVKTVGVVMPASVLDKSVFDLGVEALRSAGYRVKLARRLSFGNRASIEERVADFEEVWLDPEVDIVLCARGGVGCEDLADSIDWTKLEQRRDQRLLGFSNVTVLLNCMMKHGVGHPFSGPNLGSLCTCEGDTLPWLARVLANQPLPASRLRALKAGAFSGKSCGGHIGLVRKCLGSGWAPDASGRVVFLERNNSMTVRGIGRELDAIVASGYLDCAAGIVFGDVTPGKKDSGESWADAEPYLDPAELNAALAEMNDVKNAFAAKVKCPVYDGFSYGHIPVMHTIDFDRVVSVSADGTMIWK